MDTVVQVRSPWRGRHRRVRGLRTLLNQMDRFAPMGDQNGSQQSHDPGLHQRHEQHGSPGATMYASNNMATPQQHHGGDAFPSPYGYGHYPPSSQPQQPPFTPHIRSRSGTTTSNQAGTRRCRNHSARRNGGRQSSESKDLCGRSIRVATAPASSGRQRNHHR